MLRKQISPIDALQGTNWFHSFIANKLLLLKGKYPANVQAFKSGVIFFLTIPPYLLQCNCSFSCWRYHFCESSNTVTFSIAQVLTLICLYEIKVSDLLKMPSTLLQRSNFSLCCPRKRFFSPKSLIWGCHLSLWFSHS